jgi:hypothetical protein
MPRSYRALISMPISAENDDDAAEQAYAHARSLLWPGSTTIGGHLERLAEVPGGGLETKRIVIEDDQFLTQLL